MAAGLVTGTIDHDDIEAADAFSLRLVCLQPGVAGIDDTRTFPGIYGFQRMHMTMVCTVAHFAKDDDPAILQNQIYFTATYLEVAGQQF